MAGRFPYEGLRYPKSDEKPPFQTREEIERQIAAGGLKPAQVKELWEALYLQSHEIAELLAHAKEHAAHPWVYPLIAMAAHTGARRSELIRMGVGDVDLDGGIVTVRERKRVKGKRSTRRAPLTPLLKTALLGVACGPSRRPRAVLPCRRGRAEQEAKPDHRPSERRAPGDDATRQDGDGAPASGGSDPALSRPRNATIISSGRCRGSKWQVVRGLHVLRHSFISCLAAAGVDQRIIDDIVGHQRGDAAPLPAPDAALKSQAVLTVFNSPETAGQPQAAAAAPPVRSEAAQSD